MRKYWFEIVLSAFSLLWAAYTVRTLYLIRDSAPHATVLPSGPDGWKFNPDGTLSHNGNVYALPLK